MKVFIANFGRGNYLWPDCYRRNTIATIDDADVHHFWDAGDRQGYIDYSIAHKKTVRGEMPTKPVASRWYGIMHTINETSGDVWVHREKEGLWWTTSTGAPLAVELHPSTDPDQSGPQVYQFHKACEPWSDRTRKGALLSWTGLHAKAKEFLFTEGALQQLHPNNAKYTCALINGDDLGEKQGAALRR